MPTIWRSTSDIKQNGAHGVDVDGTGWCPPSYVLWPCNPHQLVRYIIVIS